MAIRPLNDLNKVIISYASSGMQPAGIPKKMHRGEMHRDKVLFQKIYSAYADYKEQETEWEKTYGEDSHKNC